MVIPTWLGLLFSLVAKEIKVLLDGPFLWHSSKISRSSFLQQRWIFKVLRQICTCAQTTKKNNLHEYIKFWILPNYRAWIQIAAMNWWRTPPSTGTEQESLWTRKWQWDYVILSGRAGLLKELAPNQHDLKDFHASKAETWSSVVRNSWIRQGPVVWGRLVSVCMLRQYLSQKAHGSSETKQRDVCPPYVASYNKHTECISSSNEKNRTRSLFRNVSMICCLPCLSVQVFVKCVQALLLYSSYHGSFGETCHIQ